MCLILLFDTSMFSISLCLKRSRDSSPKLSKDCCLSEVPSLDLAGDSSIVNGKYIPIAKTDQAMSALSTGPAFQLYTVKNIPCNHW